MARRTKEDALATREALLDAAELVFEQCGVSRTSLSDIAKAAGVTRGAVYWHFKDKADLFNAMLERVTLPLEAELAGLCEGVCDPMRTLLERLRGSMRQIAQDEQTRRVLTIATMMVEHVEDLGPVRERHVQVDRANVRRMQDAFEQAAARRGLALPGPAAQLARGFYAMVHGLVYGWLLDGGFDLEATADTAIRAYLRGIGLDPAPAGAP